LNSGDLKSPRRSEGSGIDGCGSPGAPLDDVAGGGLADAKGLGDLRSPRAILAVADVGGDFHRQLGLANGCGGRGGDRGLVLHDLQDLGRSGEETGIGGQEVGVVDLGQVEEQAIDARGVEGQGEAQVDTLQGGLAFLLADLAAGAGGQFHVRGIDAADYGQVLAHAFFILF
jgi:hypothetical protein